MSLPAIPTGWVHVWLKPLYTWLVALKAFVEGGSSGGWSPVRALTNGALPANTYDSGTQTKTANANGALPAVDGVTLIVGDRLWDKDSATGSEQGLFEVVSVGSAGTKWSMKRASDASVSADFVSGKLLEVGAEGTVNGGVVGEFVPANFVLDTDTPTLQLLAGVMYADQEQTVTGSKAFVDQALRVWNAARTAVMQFRTTATADRTVTFPDTDLTVAQADVATDSTTPADTGSADGADGTTAAANGADATTASASGADPITAGASATNQTEQRANSIIYNSPVAADLTSIVNTVDAANGPQVIAAQMNEPRKIQVRIVDGDGSISAGLLSISGRDSSGKIIGENIELFHGTQTRVTAEAYASISTVSIGELVGAAPGDTISLGPSLEFGLPAVKGPSGPVNFVVYKASVDGVAEAVGVVDSNAGTIAPTTFPDGTKTYQFFYYFDVVVPQNAHTHGVTNVGHTHGIGNVSHTHAVTSVSHVHTSAAHTHDQT